MLHEQVFSDALAFASLSVGDKVRVVTLMGSPVLHGVIIRIYPYGAVQVRGTEVVTGGALQSQIENIYDTDLYYFLPHDGDDVVAAHPEYPAAAGTTIPATVSAVGDALVGESTESAEERPVLYLDRGEWRVYPDGTKYHAAAVAMSERLAEDEAADIAEAKAKDKKEPADKKAGKQSDPRKDTRSTSSKVNVAALPADLQRRLRGVNELDSDSRDRVLASVSDAAMRAFKAVGVRDADIYSRVVLIQDAIKPVLGIGDGSDTK